MRTCVRIFNKVNKLKLAVDRSSQQRLSRHCLRTKPDVFTSGDADSVTLFHTLIYLPILLRRSFSVSARDFERSIIVTVLN